MSYEADCHYGDHRWLTNGRCSRGQPLTEQAGGQLNPTWVEWLMGFPLGWTDLGPSETPSSRKSSSSSGGASSKRRR